MRENIGRLLIGFPISMLTLSVYKQECGLLVAAIIAVVYLALFHIGLDMVYKK